MCGIAGLLSWDSAVDAQVLKRMTGLVEHRGPDDEGYALWGEVTGGEALPSNKTVFPEQPDKGSAGRGGAGLGHRRLSILDLSPAGHQPMASRDRRYWIVFNGEIYNYKEIRAELAAQGEGFVSGSDTEVILAAYQKWGEQCLHRFNGMWSIAIYDSLERTLFASRDRFGVKPFYYSLDDRRFGFGSEIKQLHSAGFGTGKAQRSNVAKFLLQGIVNASRETMFENIFQLLPGHALRWRIAEGPGRIQTFRWYAPEFNQKMGGSSPRSLPEYKETFSHLLVDAVKLRLRSDVPVGVALSGGLDSSSITMLASRELKARDGYVLKTFTSCFEDSRYDEWNFASMVAEAAGVEPHRVFPDMDSIWEEMKQLSWHQDEPFRQASVFAGWNVMRLAHRNGIKVLLEGQGADEVLVGYHRHIPEFLGALTKSGYVAQAVGQFRAMRRTGILTASDTPVRVAAKIVRSSVGVRAFRKSPVHRMMHSGLGAIETASPTGPFQSRLYDEIFGYLQSLLRHGDRNSMAFSIESRLPFLDYRLVEMFLEMPAIYKMRDGWTKPFAREAMEGIMPEQVRLRVDKKGFVTPEAVWYQDGMKRMRDLLLAHDAPIQHWVNRKKLGEWLGQAASNRTSGSTLWRIFSVNCWMRAFQLA